jgi:hypothetical protein
MRVPRHHPFSYRPSAGAQHELREQQEEEEQQDVALRHESPLLRRGTVGIAGGATALAEENDGC